jgi:hypothetical protein
MIAQILSALGFLKELWGVIKQAIAAWKQARKEGWIADHDAVTTAIRDAKTDEERRALAKKLADLVRSSP